MLATQAQRLPWRGRLSWRDSLSFGLWRLVTWIASVRADRTRAVAATGFVSQQAPVPAASLMIDGVEYVDVGRRYPIRADRLDYFYRAAD